jgi:hypothetical protein
MFEWGFDHFSAQEDPMRTIAILVTFDDDLDNPEDAARDLVAQVNEIDGVMTVAGLAKIESIATEVVDSANVGTTCAYSAAADPEWVTEVHFH